MEHLILVVNPGSTSTKIAVYEGRKQIFLKKIRHLQEILQQFDMIADQFEFRKNTIDDELSKAGINIKNISIVVGRGGLLKPIAGGVYKVNDAMIHDIYHPMGEHESNLGGLIAYELAKEINRKVMAIIVDPTCVDEMEDIARISGMPELPRKSFLHALNQRAVARMYARDIGKKYEEINVIVAHMGGGLSVGAHRKGRIIDVNNGLNGEGPMSPERSGGLPVGQLVELCFSNKFSKAEILRKIKGKGGLTAYLGTSDALEIEKRIEQGDEYAKLIYNAMSYQVAKEIGALSAVLHGEVDGILLTGGIAYGEMVTSFITEMVKHLGPVKVYPGEGEMEALALNGYLVLSGEVEVKEYV
ncbi:MAG TPA: butyrate kinase [Bacteroidales bacterium]|nr:butyrate kinase [Bacteroidales bacterium]HPS15759.1 butyrate kinase [Bacteroidales bacterium]